ncbi:hypothetical protein RN001_005802 [Aquatica leii]|uniref:Uncharacterized protein n=1 Tax=Aquatica leii TaxID=1421715 RepID=A0AAN7QKK3_9COLE|nr:hypothetical protein RN001_005802 [Aquatica leii]
MSTVWNLNDPKQAEEALNYLYGLPDEEYNSDVEPDPDAVEEYLSLDHGLSVATKKTVYPGDQLQLFPDDQISPSPALDSDCFVVETDNHPINQKSRKLSRGKDIQLLRKIYLDEGEDECRVEEELNTVINYEKQFMKRIKTSYKNNKIKISQSVRRVSDIKTEIKKLRIKLNKLKKNSILESNENEKSCWSKVCCIELRAHRTDLLKHASTQKHKHNLGNIDKSQLKLSNIG